MASERGSVIQGHFPHGLPRISAPPAHRTPPTPIVQPAVQSRLAPPRLGFSAVPEGHPCAAGRVVQRLANGSAVQLPAALTSFGNGGGQRLPAVVQQKMEAFFKTSFADVRVHFGPQASAIGALAFTCGSNLFFAPGQYDPSTARGQQLLGHELTHVVQQRAGRVRNPFGSGVAVIQDHALEAEAERMGQQAARNELPVQAKLAATGTTRTAARVGGAVQRMELPNSIAYSSMGKTTTEQDLRDAVAISGLKPGAYSGHLSQGPGSAESPQTQAANTKIAKALKVVKDKKKTEGKQKAKQDKDDGYKKGGCKNHAALKSRGLEECGVCGQKL